MDSRHETLDQEILNRIVNYLNHFITTNTDEILIKEWLATDIKSIAENIYHYAQIEVDLQNMLAKKNLLSLDLVKFPIIDDASLCRVERHNSDFSRLLTSIASIVNKRNNIDMGQHQFYVGINQILSAYNFK